MRARAIGLFLIPLLQAGGGSPPREGPAQIEMGNDRYLAGSNIRLSEDVPGDLVIAGGQLDVGGSIGQELLLAGGSATVRGRIGDDIRAAAGDLRLDRAIVGGSAVLTGGTVVVSPDSVIRQGLLAAGSEVDVGGTVQSGARIAGNRVQISGQIEGPVSVSATELILRSGARIDGPLSYGSPRLLVLENGAVVTGPISFTQLPEPWQGPGILFNLLISLGLVIIGLILTRVFPKAVDTVAGVLEAEPLRSLGTGLVAVIVIPVFALFCLITVVGIPLSVLSMVLWGVAIGLSRIFVSYALARMTLARMTLSGMPLAGMPLARTTGEPGSEAPSGELSTGEASVREMLAREMSGVEGAGRGIAGSSHLREVTWMTAFIVLIGLLQMVPLLGWIVRALVAWAGVGALIVALWRQRTHYRPAPERVRPGERVFEPTPIMPPGPMREA